MGKKAPKNRVRSSQGYELGFETVMLSKGMKIGKVAGKAYAKNEEAVALLKDREAELTMLQAELKAFEIDKVRRKLEKKKAKAAAKQAAE